MTSFSQQPLQKALYQRLTGDGTLMALIEGVYDRPPQGSAYPYVIIGDGVSRDWSSKTSAGMEQILTLHVWSREGGRKQALQIMERIHFLLHDSNFAVEGQALVLLRFLSSQMVLEDDGWTYHGTLQLRALLETTS